VSRSRSSYLFRSTTDQPGPLHPRHTHANSPPPTALNPCDDEPQPTTGYGRRKRRHQVSGGLGSTGVQHAAQSRRQAPVPRQQHEPTATVEGRQAGEDVGSTTTGRGGDVGPIPSCRTTRRHRELCCHVERHEGNGTATAVLNDRGAPSRTTRRQRCPQPPSRTTTRQREPTAAELNDKEAKGAHSRQVHDDEEKGAHSRQVERQRGKGSPALPRRSRCHIELRGGRRSQPRPCRVIHRQRVPHAAMSFDMGEGCATTEQRHSSALVFYFSMFLLYLDTKQRRYPSFVTNKFDFYDTKGNEKK
jgi:hypothetical protein